MNNAGTNTRFVPLSLQKDIKGQGQGQPSIVPVPQINQKRLGTGTGTIYLKIGLSLCPTCSPQVQGFRVRAEYSPNTTLGASPKTLSLGPACHRARGEGWS